MIRLEFMGCLDILARLNSMGYLLKVARLNVSGYSQVLARFLFVDFFVALAYNIASATDTIAPIAEYLSIFHREDKFYRFQRTLFL